MGKGDVPTKVLDGLSFKMYSTEEIVKMSVLEITNTTAFDKLLSPCQNGLHDPRLGPSNEGKCVTCGQSSTWCIGHMSYIKLPLPVFNPLFLRSTFNLLRVTCINCHKFNLPSSELLKLTMKMKALRLGLPNVALDMQQVASQASEADESAGDVKDDMDLAQKLDELLKNGMSDLHESKDDQRHTKTIVELENRYISDFYKSQTTKAKCNHCNYKNPKLFLEHNVRIVIAAKAAKSNKPTDKKGNKKKPNKDIEPDDLSDLAKCTAQNYLTPKAAKEHLRKVYENEPLVMNCLYGALVDLNANPGTSPTDVLFLDVFPVEPTRFRPLMKHGERSFLNPKSTLITSILIDSIQLKYLVSAINNVSLEIPAVYKQILVGIRGETDSERLNTCWNSLQTHVNSVFDCDMDKLERERVPGVKQLLEKKEGLFRKHMMGKRVNYAARSVISPDPYIDIDEVGVPEVFAKCLTYPTPVTPWNVKELRQAVMNGPDVHPGAMFVRMEDGSVTQLTSSDGRAREAIAKQLLIQRDEGCLTKPKIVYRHLRNGDIVLMNRQPTLHKPSIMAHKVRVLHGERTLRLNYSNCKTYNADFDGDEMNIHFPQSELARSEGYNIANVDHQYLVPKDGTPLGGLIQDHIVSAVLLMTRGRFFERADYHQLVFGALTHRDGHIKLVPPAIMKPRALWSGKQVASTVIINTIPVGEQLFSLTRKTKTPVKCWQKERPRAWLAGGSPLSGVEMSESEVIIRNGEVLSGVLDKAHCGPTPYGLIHCCYEIYGGQVAMMLLSRLERLFTHFLQTEGFTLGVEDILVVPKADRKRKRLMKKASRMGRDVVRQALDLPEDVDDEVLNDKYAVAHLRIDDKAIRNLDMCMKAKTDQINNDINRVCMPNGLRRQFPENNLQLMVLSGSKGATVNCMQISCLLGQIELEGRRPPMMISGKTLPSFLPYCTSPRAGGFVDGRFLTGIKPQEYFFHCMAGREGLIDTAVKTSRSGYLQRCLIKHMEGLTVAYDLTVRDSDGSVIQFMYGEDALDIPKVPFLKGEQLQFLVDNQKVLYKQNDIDKFSQISECKHEKLLKLHKKVRKHWAKHDPSALRVRNSGFLEFSNYHLAEMGATTSEEIRDNKGKVTEMWHQLNPKEKSKYTKKAKLLIEPVFSTYRPDANFGSISEKLDQLIEDYLSGGPVGFDIKNETTATGRLPNQSEVRKMFHHKIMTSFCQPGEAVGLLAAQSVGEPSTQMTLNTFHFAGRGEMNVTLGIPRLREILMTATKEILTPSMEVPFLNCPNLETEAMKLKRKLSRVHLSDVVKSIETSQGIVEDGSSFFRHYKIRFNFLPRKAYRDNLLVTPDRILKFMEKYFLSGLARVVDRWLIAQANSSYISDVKKRKQSYQTKEKTGGGDDDEAGDSEEVNAESEPIVDEFLDDADSSSDEMADNEEDAAAVKKGQGRHDQEREYDEEEDESKNAEEGDENADDSTSVVENADSAAGKKIKKELVKKEDGNEDADFMAGSDEVWGEINEEGDDAPESVFGDDSQDEVDEFPEDEALCGDREKSLKAKNKLIKSYSYDTKHGRWCEVVFGASIGLPTIDINRLVREHVELGVLRSIKDLKMAYISDQKNADGSTTKMLKTDGINIPEMFKYEDILDLRRLHTNNVHEMAAVYGIEAAGRILVKEIKNVFQVYGIEVDSRHLLLIADYMTSDGVYKAFSRMALSNCISPLQQMTFETTTNFMKVAAQKGVSDQLKSPSSRLVVGRPVGCGTGSFDLIHPL